MQYRQLIQNIRYASVKQLQKWENKSISLEQGSGGGRGSASAAIKTSSRKISYLVVFIRTVILGLSRSVAHLHVHVQIVRTRFAHLRAFTFLSVWHCQQHIQQTGTQRTAWQDRRPIQYNCRNSSRRMKLSSEAHSSNSSIQDQWQQGMFL